jgi:hypothetical protein
MQKQIIQLMIEVLTTLVIKTEVFGYVMPCWPLVTDISQEIIASNFRVVFLDCPEDAGSSIVSNVSN